MSFVSCKKEQDEPRLHHSVVFQNLQEDFVELPVVAPVVAAPGRSAPDTTFKAVVVVPPAVVVLRPTPRLNSSASDWRYYQVLHILLD
jgi:hypothetical protein